MAPAWVEHAIWWQVYPLGFTDAPRAAGREADPPPAARLDRIEPWLDYAVELGCSGLALGPIFASETHGYDTVDHFRIDPRLGDDAAFDRLVAAARRRGLRVLLDGVFNHVGRGFAPFQRALAEGADSEAGRWFRWERGEAAAGGAPRPKVFEGHDILVALNHDSPEVRDYVAEVMAHWLDRGAAGWRMDAAYAVPDRFWRPVIDQVRSHHPDAWFVGEVIHGDYAGRVRDGGFDSVTQYELWKATWSAINDANFFELAWALDRHNQLLEAFVPLTFIGNHDVTRIASHLVDQRHLAHALVLLFTVGGVPSVYYGDEQAFRGVKEDRAGGDDAIRPAFPDRPDQLAPEGWPVYRLHQELIGLRRRHPWLYRATTKVEHLTNQALVYASEHDGSRLRAALNLADTRLDVPVGSTRVLAAAAGLGVGADLLSVPPHGWAVWSAG